MAWSRVLPLRGAGGEPVDLARTVNSHGVASLPPMLPGPERDRLTMTLPVPGASPRTVVVTGEGSTGARLAGAGRAPGTAAGEHLERLVAHVLRLDEDLTEFYALASADPDLAWVVHGAGRLARCPTVFEEVVKTVCTTNCAWSATERMVAAIVTYLGEPAADGSRAFPTPAAMAAAGEGFYREVARAGYRAGALAGLARGVAEGALDLEVLATAGIDDEEVEQRLLALPGVGPYAAAHVMLMLGRYSRLVLDSWTRPKFARLTGRKTVSDATIRRRFARYGRWRGLAFWCYVTSDWLPLPSDASR